MTNLNHFYVYAYLDLRKPRSYIYDDFMFDFEPFYIGQGHNDRLYHHLKQAFKFRDRKIQLLPLEFILEYAKNVKIHFSVKRQMQKIVNLVSKSINYQKESIALKIKI